MIDNFWEMNDKSAELIDILWEMIDICREMNDKLKKPEEEALFWSLYN
ncbi:hypothetical protein [Saccharococcus sp. Marseille-Q5394]|nr:hypothetical protein [Saccharococcus sp. Marseille-Q5394]